MNIIAHAYCTDGFFELAKTFTESYFLFNCDIPLHLDTRGMTEDQLSQIMALCPENCQLTILNKDIDFNQLSQRTGLSVKKLKQYKHEVENNFGKPMPEKRYKDAVVWKLLTAGDERIKTVYRRLTENNAVIHFDIDMLIRGKIHALKQIAKEYDFAAKIRLGHAPKVVISIGLAVYKNTAPTKNWMRDWISIIDSVPPTHREQGFGQVSCFYAFEKHMNQLNYLDLIKNYPQFGIPWINKPNDIIWTYNTDLTPKNSYAERFRAEIKKLKMKEN